MVAMVTYFFQKFCEKLNFSNQAHSFPVNIEVISTRILTTEQKQKKC
jgi:hypothetical protein